MKKVEVKTGDVCFSKTPAEMITVLGSCVSVVIFDGKNKFGGMNHFALPNKISSNDSRSPGEYADFAIPELLKKFKAAGSAREDMVVKIIGGFTVHFGEQDVVPSVSQANIEAAQKILSGFGLTVANTAVGGTKAKEVKFNTATGQIQFREIEKRQSVNSDQNSNLKVVSKEKIKVMIVDDSRSVRMVLRKLIESDPELEVIAEAEDVPSAEGLRKSIKPDVITLDISMPGTDGVTYLRDYMQTDPVPTVMITDYNLEASGPVLDALENGAFDYLKKPSLNDLDKEGNRIKTTIKSAHASNNKITKKIKTPVKRIMTGESRLNRSICHHQIVAIGSSTGGTEAVRQVLLGLSADIPPVFVVQHIPPVFSREFANRLNQQMPFTVKEAEHGEEVEHNTVYVAPGGWQMQIIQYERDRTLRIHLRDEPPVNRFKPSVDYMFKSVAPIKRYKKTAVLLTGMGVDGAQGMLELKKVGAKTIAESEKTAVVFGMPRAAIELGAAQHVLELQDIPQKIEELIMLNDKERRELGLKKTGT